MDERHSEAARKQALEVLERDYRARHQFVQPYRVTMALDLEMLDGPEVDAACLAAEPDVDMWEAGTAAPSWEQLEALAELTGQPIKFFFVESDEGALPSTFMCGPRGCEVHEAAPRPEPFYGGKTNVVQLFAVKHE